MRRVPILVKPETTEWNTDGIALVIENWGNEKFSRTRGIGRELVEEIETAKDLGDLSESALLLSKEIAKELMWT